MIVDVVIHGSITVEGPARTAIVGGFATVFDRCSINYVLLYVDFEFLNCRNMKSSGLAPACYNSEIASVTFSGKITITDSKQVEFAGLSSNMVACQVRAVAVLVTFDF